MAGPCVVAGAGLQCAMGMAPATLMVVPAGRPLVEGKPAAVITDIAPMVNIPSFGMCQSLANPTVAAATAAALGTLTPMPCVPVPVMPWSPPAAQTVVGGIPGFTATARTTCAYGGSIGITMPGSVRTTIG